MISFQGLRVLNTRPTGQQQTLSHAIENAGGVSIECPLLRIVPIEFNNWAYLKHLQAIDQIIFISTNAVHYFFSYLRDIGLQFPASIRVSAIGEATANQLNTYGIHVDALPVEPSSEYLLQLEQMQAVKNQTIVLVKGEDGREQIRETLSARGANVICLDVYRRDFPKASKPLLESLWLDDEIDVMIFTSAQAMYHLFALLSSPKAHEWVRQKTVVVISERLAEVAKELGIKRVIICPYKNLLG